VEQPNYLTMEVTAVGLYVRAVKEDGSLIDEINIKK